MSKFRKYLLRISVILNFVIFIFLVWLALGGAVDLVLRFAIYPQQERLDTQQRLLEVKMEDTVFLGDSITEGGFWHELFPDSNIRQRGIGGDTTTGVLGRLAPIIEGKPAQIFLLIGTNDIFFGVSHEDIVTNINTIVDQIKENSPDTEIYVQSILPRAKWYQSTIEAINADLERSMEGKAKWINLYPLFLDEAGESISDELSNDELHLLGKGYLIWQDAIQELVEQTEQLRG